ncbi:AsnC family transcriptional regulator [Rhizobium sp. Pop5]|nr:AsnC family transcriptional regulator [Rhizobium sp. Pop5]
MVFRRSIANLDFLVSLNSIAMKAKKALIFRPSFAILFHRNMDLSKRVQPSHLDDFDRKILAILQRDNITPQRTIGDAVNLSAPAVQRRIKRMREEGVIRADVSVIEPEALGQSITIFVEVEVISETAEQIERAKSEFAAAAEIQQCYYVTGESDFILVIIVPSMADYEALTRRLFFGNNNVKRFRTFVAMDRVKVGLEVPVG